MKTIPEYISEVQQELTEAERQEDYEGCIEILEYINILKNRDKVGFLHKEFDVERLTELGFFKKGITDLQRVKRIETFFGYETIFQYSLGDPLNCHLSPSGELPF